MKIFNENSSSEIIDAESVVVNVRDSENDDNYISEFIQNQETLDAMKEAEDIASGKIKTKTYKTFDDMWSDICGTYRINMIGG